MADIFDEMAGFADKIMKDECKRIENVMKDVVGVDTGALRDSITTQRLSTTEALVGVDEGKLKSDPRNKFGISYVKFYHDGTRPYTIRAKNAKALSWVGKDGKVHFAKSVRHPGNKPHPFIKWTLDKL